MAADAEIKVGADAKAFNKTLQGMQESLNEGCTSMTARLARLGGALNAVGTISGGVWGAVKTLTGGLASAFKAVIEPAATAEEIEMKFTRFTGSATAAMDLIDKLTTYAAKTSFAMNEINDAANVLLAATDLTNEGIVSMINSLGELAKAADKPLVEVAMLYAKAASVGVTNEILESFSTMKLPVRSIMAELRGVTEKELFDMASKRMITLEHLNATIESLTEAGGKYNGVVADTGTSFKGMMGTLEDGIEICLQKFGRELLPFLKDVINELIAAVDAAIPVFKVLGNQIANTLGKDAASGLANAIREMALRIPEIGIQLQYAFAKIHETIKSIMPLVEKIVGNEPPKEMQDKAWWNARKALQQEHMESSDSFRVRPNSPLWYLKLHMRYREELEKLLKADAGALERARDEQLAALRAQNKEIMEQARLLEEQEKQEAAARDAAAEQQRQAVAEEKKRKDELRRTAMIAAEEAQRAEQERKKLIEENEKRLIAYQERRAKWEQKQADKERERMSITKQRRQLTGEAERLGVEGVVSPESIRARLDALAAAGAKSNEKEIADLEHLLEQWDALSERKKNYVKMRAEAEGNLRADALEAAGRHQAAARLREEMETARRIEELKNAGFSARRAADIAAAESSMRRYKGIASKIQNARVEFIQGHQAAEGGGGVSLRVGGAALDQAKEQTRLQKELRNIAQKILTRTTTHSNIAVLA